MTEQLKPEFIMGGNGLYAGIDEDDAAEINFPCMLISLPNEGDFAKMRAVLEAGTLAQMDGLVLIRSYQHYSLKAKKIQMRMGIRSLMGWLAKPLRLLMVKGLAEGISEVTANGFVMELNTT